MDTIQKLTELFRQFPGIGPRQAKRFVYFLLAQKNGYAGDMAKLISELHQEIICCEMCFRFYAHDKSAGKLCHICRSEHRDATLLMVVSRDVDLENIEKTKTFNGNYFILGGNIPILESHPEEKIRQKELLHVLQTRIKSGLKEVILALDYNPEGENTRDYVERMLGPLSIEYGFTISALGRGLSLGTELEYSDGDTIKSAFVNRK